MERWVTRTRVMWSLVRNYWGDQVLSGTQLIETWHGIMFCGFWWTTFCLDLSPSNWACDIFCHRQSHRRHCYTFAKQIKRLKFWCGYNKPTDNIVHSIYTFIVAHFGCQCYCRRLFYPNEMTYYLIVCVSARQHIIHYRSRNRNKNSFFFIITSTISHIWSVNI